MYFRGLSKDEILSKNRVESYDETCKKNQFKMLTLFGQKIKPSSEKAITSSESDFFDLNETPVNEPVSNQHQCIFQDLNFPYTEEMEISSEKSDFTLICLAGTSSPASCCTAENNSLIEQEVIQIAAESLVHISLVSRSNSSFEDHGFLNKPEMIGIEEPSCCSCDSYELQVLGIRETIPEDVCCVSSKPIDELNDKKKEFGVKVRRGKTRMKNFQKEILPELVSLSRNEIREDINILESVLRSREYKKMQGKTRDSECKDSTQRYEGRRRRRTK